MNYKCNLYFKSKIENYARSLLVRMNEPFEALKSLI